MRVTVKHHPLLLDSDAYWPRCQHCIARLIADLLDEDLHDRSIVWRLLDRVIERLEPDDLHTINPDIHKARVCLMTSSDLTRSQKEADRNAIAYILASLFNV